MADDSLDVLELAWRKVYDDPAAETKFLHQLSCARIIVLVYRRPGGGSTSPAQDLVRWRREAIGDEIVPIFTHVRHLTIPVPSSAQALRVSTRVLLAEGGPHRYLVNPLSGVPLELTSQRISVMRAGMEARSQESLAPSPDSLWTFRHPLDTRFPVAMALGKWLIESACPSEAYLYELTRGAEATVLVLGLDRSPDSAMAVELTTIAQHAGLDGHEFVVRFLPEEPSHRAGIEGIRLAPFYSRREAHLRSD